MDAYSTGFQQRYPQRGGLVFFGRSRLSLTRSIAPRDLTQEPPPRVEATTEDVPVMGKDDIPGRNR